MTTTGDDEMTTEFTAWGARCADMLKAYEEAMATQSANGPDAKLIVMANYGDLCAGLLKPHTIITAEIARLQAQADALAGALDELCETARESVELADWPELQGALAKSRAALAAAGR